MTTPAAFDIETFVVRLTARGRGAIATLLLAGPRAAEWLTAEFRPAGTRGFEPWTNKLRVGTVGPPPTEQVVVHRAARDRFEIHCHGGTAAVGRLERIFVDRGAKPTTWEEWLEHERIDPFIRDARRLLASATTFRTAAILLDQANGALRRGLSAAEVELAAGATDAALRRLETMFGFADVGAHLITPYRVVLAGPPNAGKSSLFNALLGHDRAIVHPACGTTRDLVRAATAIDGWPVELIDTAGLRQTANPVETEGVRLAERMIAEADLVVWVNDGSGGAARVEWEEFNVRDRLIEVQSKCDLHPTPRGSTLSDEAHKEGPKLPLSALRVSAVNGEGIAELLEKIVRELVPDPPPPGAAVPCTPGQVGAVKVLLKWHGRLGSAEN